MESKAEKERRIFRQFAKSAGFSLTDDSVVSVEPPQPDILFSSGSVDLAFELVELIDRDLARRHGIMFMMLKELPIAFKKQPADIQAAINERYADAQVFVNFRNSAGKFKRRALYAETFRCIAHEEINESGDLVLPESVTEVIERITIYRSAHCKGPQFDTCSAGNVADPTIDRLGEKFAKSYETSVPIHLLAYVDGHPMMPDDIWLPNTKSFLESRSDLGPFKKIWIFDLRENLVKLSWDIPGAN